MNKEKNMKATGIVRRIDDLGRVVIPKEIRKMMKIREGDPLELYIDSDGSVTLKRYSAIPEQDYNKAKQILKLILPNGTHFALYDCFGDIQAFTSKSQFEGEYRIARDEYMPDGCYEIRDYDIVGYIYIKGSIDKGIKQTAIDVLTAFYKED